MKKWDSSTLIEQSITPKYSNKNSLFKRITTIMYSCNLKILYCLNMFQSIVYVEKIGRF